MRDVGMVQRCEDFGFTLEAIHASGITGKHLGQYFERDLAFQFRVGGAIDLTHSAFADQGCDFVRAELSSRCHLFFKIISSRAGASSELRSSASRLVAPPAPAAGSARL